MYNLEWLKNNPQNVLLEVLSGSHAYGTATPTSDKDTRGVFILPLDAILGMDYRDQINDEKNDIVYYEIRRFLELTASNNPTILELLNAPADCVLIKHPLFDEFIKHKEKFITKICRNSFGGYAKQQIVKAKGLNKKQNWEDEKIERKTVLDFCYVPYKQGSMPLKEFLKANDWVQEDCGLVAIPHMREMYSLYYDRTRGNLKFRGVVQNEEKSNEVCLSSVPKLSMPDTQMCFNKDGYTSHCVDYNSYQIWLKERNVQRYVDVKAHGQKIDGKNMLHCRRLLEMAREIAEGKGINVRRQNAQELLAIRRGEVPLQELIDWAEKEIIEVDRLFRESTLPDEVDPIFVNQLLVDIRKKYYSLCL